MPRRPVKPANTAPLAEYFVSDPAQLRQCLDQLSRSPVIGYDTEFVGEDSFRPELCLLQVSTAEALYVIDPFAVGSLDEFWELLIDPERVTVIHAGREDIRICLFQCGRPLAGVFDVQLAAGLVGIPYPISYSGLVSELLGLRMTKSETLTDWRRRPLLPAQLRYAFDDVRYLLPVWKKLSDRLKRLKRVEWAAAEFATAVKKAVGDEETAAEKWRKVKGVGALDRRQLAVVRELYRWREKFAERVNRPPRQLLRDDILAEIARRAPTRHEDLSAYRGVPRGEIDSILKAVHRAHAIPAQEWPLPEARENDPPHVVMLANLLGVVLADWCTRNKLAANLVATASDLRAVVRSRVFGEPLPDLPLTGGWRAEAVMSELSAILDGKLAVRVGNPAAAAPLGFISLQNLATEPPQDRL